MTRIPGTIFHTQILADMYTHLSRYQALYVRKSSPSSSVVIQHKKSIQPHSPLDTMLLHHMTDRSNRASRSEKKKNNCKHHSAEVVVPVAPVFNW